MGWYRPHDGDGSLVWRDAADIRPRPARDALDLIEAGPALSSIPTVESTPEHADWDRALASKPVLDDPTPAQHHESGAASRDRAYHLLRQSGVTREYARTFAYQATEQARRTRGC